MRSTGRKDRHSKVCTAKGPRDRRVRLAAHTAIQFYDVQDRLGYDRPSKAVDWLIKKAKAAIDELDELPAWKPQATVNGNGEIPGEEKSDEGAAGGVFDGGGLLPPSMESDSIADTIKSFFPTGGDESSPSGSVGLQSAQFQSQDLKLSLQSFQDTQRSNQNQESEQQSPFPAAAQLGFDSPSVGWDETQQADMGRFQRLIGWNLTGGSYGGSESSSGGGGGFMFISPQPLQQQPLLFGHGVGSHGGFGHTATHLYSQGGTLQSNCTTTTTPSNQDHHHHHHHHQQPISFHPGALSGVGFSSLGGFSNFHMPGRIQDDDDDDEEQDSNTNKPSSVSSGSHH